MNIINIGDAKTQLSKLIEMALEGEEVVIGECNQPLVKLSPFFPANYTEKRVGGQLQGQIHISDDFDKLPDDVLDAFEGNRS